MIALLLWGAIAAAPLELDDVLADVARQAPEVRVRAAEADVARAGVGVAGAWDDPSVTVMAESLPLPGMTSEDPVMITYRVSQPLNSRSRREGRRPGEPVSSRA